jgi:hypothetical protein
MHGSVTLYHGPGAEGETKKRAREFGLVQPFKSSLKKDDARELVALLAQTPIGSKPWCVVVGPLDEVSPVVSDVLLKTIEEFNSDGIRPFLWAWDLGGVMPTIRSRCLHEFIPGRDERIFTSLSAAEKVLALYLKKNWGEIVTELKESKGDEEFLLLALVQILGERLLKEPTNEALLGLWSALREFFMSPREMPMTPARVLSIFLAGVA